MNEWWVSCERFTCWCKIDEHNTITDAAPILRRWIGQDFWKMAGYYKADVQRLS